MRGGRAIFALALVAVGVTLGSDGVVVVIVSPVSLVVALPLGALDVVGPVAISTTWGLLLLPVALVFAAIPGGSDEGVDIEGTAIPHLAMLLAVLLSRRQIPASFGGARVLAPSTGS